MNRVQELADKLAWPDRSAFLETGAGSFGMITAGKLVEHGHDAVGIALAVFSGATALHGVFRYGAPDTSPAEFTTEEEQQA